MSWAYWAKTIPRTLRHEVELKLHLGHTNGKSLLKRCQALGLSRQDLEDAIHG
jgi:hypothetical protein